ncbi:lipoprotein insertase outer membrane protein LolB [Chitinibacter sp. GC72]|uniref:lipoprotein insertase outer membrane protein LolB n=1 Tax=Chitinibacter sp. GC72 TaxID=1526917 RepID=UPI0012FCF08D|nr:lipoprotein insertase outer membrane protein LolB [Chitinibacter sp. GC72]
MQLVKLVLASAVLCLGACTHLPSPPAAGFSAQGKVNIRQGNQSDTAQFVWLASPAQDQLSLSTPFGSVLAELVLHYQGDTIRLAELNRGTQIDRADDPEALLHTLTGLQLPVSGLRWWLRGQARPDTPYERDGEVLIQNGWRISASDYRSGTYPYRIELSRADLKVRIMITEWNTAAP